MKRNKQFKDLQINFEVWDNKTYGTPLFKGKNLKFWEFQSLYQNLKRKLK